MLHRSHQVSLETVAKLPGVLPPVLFCDQSGGELSPGWIFRHERKALAPRSPSVKILARITRFSTSSIALNSPEYDPELWETVGLFIAGILFCIAINRWLSAQPPTLSLP
jgi:hypothetical protein